MTATIMADRPYQTSISALGHVLRVGLALALAAGVTAALFLLMRALIWVEDPAPPVVREVPTVTLSLVPEDVVATERVLPTQVEAVEPPPMQTRLPADPADNPGASAVSTAPAAVEVELDDSLMQTLPMPPPPLRFRVSPDYPRMELARGREGSCTIQYDILANGRTANARALACDSVGFERASLAALDQWRHAVASGRPGEEIVRRGVQTTLDFRLEQ